MRPETDTLAAAGAGSRARPAHREPRNRALSRVLPLLAVAIVLMALLWGSDYYSRVLSVAALAIVAACGLNILTGVTGQVSLGHAGFYALGAYAAALLSVKMGWPVLAAVPVGVGVAAVLGILLAWPALHLRGPYLTMVTIAFGMLVHSFATDFTEITNGPEGLFPIPPLNLGFGPLTLQETNIVLLVVVVAVFYLHGALIDGKYGRAMRAVRGNELAAASMGVNVVGMKCLAFAISGALAGLAGALYAPVNGFVNPDSFTFELSVILLMMVILGGQGTVWGPVAGAVLLTVLDRLLAPLGDARLVLYGGILLLTLHLMPEGLMSLLASLRARRAGPASAGAQPGGTLSGAAALEAVAGAERLEVQGVSKIFGGLKAVDNVSFNVAPRSIHGLVGPNGAGKTTLLNMISGVSAPTHGRIRHGAQAVDARPMHVLAARGIGRTFQNLALFRDMTVLENVLCGMHLSARAGFVPSVLCTPRVRAEEAALTRRALSLLEFVGLRDAAHTIASALPQGHQRLLEIARALAVRPRLLLLDEPAAGLNGAEVDRLMELIRRIRDSGVTVLLIEHHMQLVMAICETVTVLDFGKLLIEGTPQQVQHDPAVLEAYLGRPAHARGADDA
ncbi:ATP-binding cassette domain-containing protein [Bordetella petrii]|nr:ATP-binding cassette domain-containing protein [Bordetella petrii]